MLWMVKHQKNLHPVRNKRGELLSAPDEIKDRWVEHFNELHNQPTTLDFDIFHGLVQLPVMEHFDTLITMEELNTALKNTKLKKSPGPDRRVATKVLVHGGNHLKSVLWNTFNTLWVTESLPSDMIDANISILFKKDDRSQCGNDRGISLLSVAGKIFSDILLQRKESNQVIEKVEVRSMESSL